MFVLPKKVNIDICVAKSKNYENINHLGSFNSSYKYLNINLDRKMQGETFLF